jgi:adenosylcobinamide kinase/adenosylcobinamide-phosphate guanylyltransferase
MAVIFVTGPVRSGKSEYALRLAREDGRRVTYVATAITEPGDAEWTARLERHARERPPEWRTLETAAMDHADICAIFRRASSDECLVVDALGTWLGARIGAYAAELVRDYVAVASRLERESAELADAMAHSAALVIAVGEQVGWDVVPVAASARLFRDVLGRMERRLAAHAAHAYLVVAGYAIDLRVVGALVQP